MILDENSQHSCVTFFFFGMIFFKLFKILLFKIPPSVLIVLKIKDVGFEIISNSVFDIKTNR